MSGWPADGKRWEAYLTCDEPPEVAFYCPGVLSGSFAGQLDVKSVGITLALASLGAIVGGVIGAVTHWSSGPSDFGGTRGEWAIFLAVVGFAVGGACGLMGSVMWALSHRRSRPLLRRRNS
jgi:hypothetical protein